MLDYELLKKRFTETLNSYSKDDLLDWKKIDEQQSKTNKMNNELKISKERVLEAASKCSTAKQTLETLFPEVFEEESKYFDLTALIEGRYIIFGDKESTIAGFHNNEFMHVRFGGKYDGKAFYLHGSYNWELVHDEFGCLCLLPTKK